MEEAADTDIMEDMYRRYENLTDEEILLDIKEHNNKVALDYLINKYRNFVRAKARSYFLIGADREDIVQEGMIGRDFRDDKLSSFRAFAELCVTRQIITAIKTATRQKHIPLNSYVSLNKPIYDEDSDRTLLDIISGAKVSDPEELVISQEEFVLSGNRRRPRPQCQVDRQRAAARQAQAREVHGDAQRRHRHQHDLQGTLVHQSPPALRRRRQGRRTLTSLS